MYVTVDNASVAAFYQQRYAARNDCFGIVGISMQFAIDSNDVLYVGGGVEFESQGFIKKFSLSGAFLDDFVTGQPGIPNDFAFAVPELER